MSGELSKTVWRKKPMIANAVLRYGVWILVIAYLIFAGKDIKVDPRRIAMGAGRIGKLFSGFFHPDFISRGKYIIEGTLESLAI